MIDRKENKSKTEYKLDRIVQASFGYSDEQLLEQMNQAEKVISDVQIPPEEENGFEQLLAKAESRGINPYLEEKDFGEEDRKIRRLGPLIKIGLAAAVMTSVLLMTSITAGAKRSYKYEARTRVEMVKGEIINNELNKEEIDSLDSAYISVKAKIGINPLKLGEIPEDFYYLKTAMGEQRATMYFTCAGEPVYLIQQIGVSAHSINYSSDRKPATSVYNVWMNKDIPIYSAVVEGGEEELSSQIINGNSYYYFSGIIAREDFIEIVADMNFAE